MVQKSVGVRPEAGTVRAMGPMRFDDDWGVPPGIGEGGADAVCRCVQECRTRTRVPRRSACSTGMDGRLHAGVVLQAEQHVTAIVVVRPVSAYAEQRTSRVCGRPQAHGARQQADHPPGLLLPTTVRAASALSRVATCTAPLPRPPSARTRRSASSAARSSSRVRPASLLRRRPRDGGESWARLPSARSVGALPSAILVVRRATTQGQGQGQGQEELPGTSNGPWKRGRSGHVAPRVIRRDAAAAPGPAVWRGVGRPGRGGPGSRPGRSRHGRAG